MATEDNYFEYREFWPEVLDEDLAVLQKKDVEYGGSWKKRGGANVFFMLCRKWDRLEEQLKPKTDGESFGAAVMEDVVKAAAFPDANANFFSGYGRLIDEKIEEAGSAWDIIKAAVEDDRDEGILDDIRDLRRYLVNVEAEILCQKAKENQK